MRDREGKVIVVREQVTKQQKLLAGQGGNGWQNMGEGWEGQGSRGPGVGRQALGRQVPTLTSVLSSVLSWSLSVRLCPVLSPAQSLPALPPR